MSFSGDGTTWQPWQPYQAVTSWTFPAGDGTKTLWAKVENVAGVPSAAVSASVVLDTQQPGVASVDPAIGTDLVGPRPTVTVTFTKPIDSASWVQYGLLVQTPDGALVPGTFTVTAPNAGSYRPSVDLVTGNAYIVTVGSVRDIAGNLVVPIGSWVATDRAAPVVTLHASPTMVDRGATALLSGKLTAPTGVASLTLDARPAGAPTTVSLGTIPVAQDGSFSTRVTPSWSTAYRVGVPAFAGFGAASFTAVVSVRRIVRLNWSAGVLHGGRVGTRIALIATVNPAASGVPVAFRLERWNATSRSWRLVGTLNRRTDATGRATVAWVPSGSALLRWRATAGWTADYATGSSTWVRWSIGR